MKFYFLCAALFFSIHSLIGQHVIKSDFLVEGIHFRKFNVQYSYNRLTLGISHIADVRSRMIYNVFYNNTHQYKIYKNKFNPHIELGFAIFDRLSIFGGYGFIHHQRNETKCLHPMEFLSGTIICDDIINKKYDAKVQYLSFSPALTIYKLKGRFHFELVAKASAIYYWNEDSPWTGLDVFPLKTDLSNRYIFLRKSSFYLIPKIECNVAYKL